MIGTTRCVSVLTFSVIAFVFMNILCGFKMENDSIHLTGSKRETTRKLSLRWNARKAALAQGNSKVPKKQRS